ncbi:hypothetical protein AB0F17_58575 [Nonomuraea sp. NPDC026600]|uniref:hypothetical protein n=1 Tax=Nonomuraea sp. NPDC026600 TaxID=3155363 RepID=UPI0033C4A78E
MATVITANITAPVLRAAADRLAELPHPRVIRTDVHHALYNSAPAYDVAQAALDALTTYLQKLGGADWLNRFAFPRGRDQVVAELRAAADATEHPPRPSQYRITYERIGRHHNVPPLSVAAAGSGQLTTLIEVDARKYLLSPWFEVHVDLAAMNGWIISGLHVSGRFAIEVLDGGQ